MMLLAKLLPQFDGSSRRGSLALAECREASDLEQQLQMEQRISFATQKATTQALELARTEYALQLARSQSDFQLQLKQEKELWHQNEGAKNAETIDLALTQIETTLNTLFVQAIKPFLRKNIVELALAEAEALISSASGDRAVYHLKLCGPESMILKLQAGIDKRGINTQVVIQDDLEVQISCDEFVIMTRISNWLKKIDETGMI